MIVLKLSGIQILFDDKMMCNVHKPLLLSKEIYSKRALRQRPSDIFPAGIYKLRLII